MSFNGWSNRETWCINLWFNPETREDVDAIRAQVDEDFDNIPDYMRDLIDISAINWEELYSSVE